MPLSWVKVQRQDGQGIGDDVFVGGAYEFPAGFIGAPFRTETGENTFETLGPDQTPIWRAVQDIELSDAGNTADKPVPVILKRIKQRSKP
jgi:hypothetical protein